ncbi:ATP-binding cassette domain-containing protein [Thermocladium modestius]|nr:ATP-binding cassette domain-containing protein [Thermocladium modestius]
MVVTINVKKTYGDFKLSASASMKGVVALLGRNGSGKTTLLRIIAGLEKPDSGWVLMDGVDVTRRPPWARRAAYVSPTTYIPYLRVEKHLGIASRLELDYAKDLLREYSIPMQEKVGRLSMGQREVVAILTALSSRPRALLLDEAAANISSPMNVLGPVAATCKEVGIDMIYAAQGGYGELFESVFHMDAGKLSQRAP